jgi:hypothetical protein
MKQFIQQISIFTLLILFTQNCKESIPKQTTPAFYFWKSNFKLTEIEKKTLRSNYIQKLYIKFFDVSWNSSRHHPQFIAPIRFSENLPDSRKIVPTVFITNETLVNLPNAEIEPMAKAVFEKIQSLFPQKKSQLIEIQIDCDWTLTTKQKYFRLLEMLKKNNIQLSVTIRLHQVKFYEKTGVPPVDRGMLMCYNMSDWKNIDTKNSIFTPQVLSQYIQNLEQYPMPLDVVMPIFHWTIIYRNDRFLVFMNNLDKKAFLDKKLFQTSDNQIFISKKNTSAFGISVREGDVFRTEEVDFDDLLKGSKIVLQKISNQKLTFALYHLDEKSLSHYSNEQIDQLFHVHETFR